MSISSRINGIGGAVFLSIGGIIASHGWRSVFFTYIYAVVLLILVVLFLPKFPPIQREAQGSKRSAKLTRMFYALAVAGGVHTMLYFLIPTSLSLYVTDNGIGFGSPLFMKGIQALFHFSTTRETFMMLAIGLGLTTAVYLPLTRTRRLRNSLSGSASSVTK